MPSLQSEERPDALLILADRVFLHNRQRIVDFANEQRLPNVNAYKELVEDGGLMSYGPSYEDMHKRAAIYVDKILKGAKPEICQPNNPASRRPSSTSKRPKHSVSQCRRSCSGSAIS